MRKPIWKRAAALTLAVILALSLVACGGKTNNNVAKDPDPAPQTDPDPAPAEDKVSEAVKALAGAYAVDISELGMPLVFYLVINEDGTFQLTNAVTDGAVTGADKGNGKVGESDGVYMLLYSDSTAEASKTATFEVDGSNLVFVNTLPYGSSNIAANLDGETPIYPVAKSMAYSEYLGDYAGSYDKTVEAMGMNILYEFSLNLTYGAEYTFLSSFTVMGEPQLFVQEGTFAIDGGKLTLTPAEGAAAEGTISGDGEIAITLPLSAMSKTGDDITMQRATTAAYAGTYAGVKGLAMGPMVMDITTSLKLDMLGGYTYTALIEGEEPFVQVGTYAPNDDGTLTFTADEEGAEPQVGTLTGSDSLTAKFRVSADVPMATEVVFYSSRVQGTFTAGAEDGAATTGTLTLNPDGTYQFTMAEDGEVVSEEAGTFAISVGMAGSAIDLTSEAGAASSGSVSDGGINLNYTTATGESIGFKLAPAPAEETGVMMPGGMGGEAPAGMGEAPAGMGEMPVEGMGG